MLRGYMSKIFKLTKFYVRFSEIVYLDMLSKILTLIYFVTQCSVNFTSSCMSIVAIELNKDISNLACNIILYYHFFHTRL